MFRRMGGEESLPTKPDHVVDRDREWDLLAEFLTDPDPAMRLGIVSGRRRHGKSYLLQALSEQVGGLYVTAVREEGRLPAIRRFSDAVAAQAGLRPGSLRLTDWRDVLSNALDVTARSSHPLLVIDELPYLLQPSPEIPGLLQQLYDERQRGAPPGAGSGPRLILCGSAMSVMHELLSGTKPLRGRAVVDPRLGAFGYRDSRAFWRIDDPLTALKVHAVLGGAPGYRPVAARPHPDDGFDAWLTRTLLDPGVRCTPAPRPSTCCARTRGSRSTPCTTTSSPRSRRAPPPPARSVLPWSARATPSLTPSECWNPPATSGANRTSSAPGTPSSPSPTPSSASTSSSPSRRPPP